MGSGKDGMVLDCDGRGLLKGFIGVGLQRIWSKYQIVLKSFCNLMRGYLIGVAPIWIGLGVLCFSIVDHLSWIIYRGLQIFKSFKKITSITLEHQKVISFINTLIYLIYNPSAQWQGSSAF